MTENNDGYPKDFAYFHRVNASKPISTRSVFGNRNKTQKPRTMLLIREQDFISGDYDAAIVVPNPGSIPWKDEAGNPYFELFTFGNNIGIRVTKWCPEDIRKVWQELQLTEG